VSARRGPTAPLPIDDRPDDPEELVRVLRTCASDELCRARRHHRRALKALTNGQYDALSDRTRRRLIGRLRADLTALNRALAPSHADPDDNASPPTARTDAEGLWAFLKELW
jgi:hypothetical protein